MGVKFFNHDRKYKLANVDWQRKAIVFEAWKMEKFHKKKLEEEFAKVRRQDDELSLSPDEIELAGEPQAFVFGSGTIINNPDDFEAQALLR